MLASIPLYIPDILPLRPFGGFQLFYFFLVERLWPVALGVYDADEAEGFCDGLISWCGSFGAT